MLLGFRALPIVGDRVLPQGRWNGERRLSRFHAFLAMAVAISLQPTDSYAASPIGIPPAFAELSEASCADCHSGPDSEARLDLTLLSKAPLSANLADWRRVLRVLGDESMPPPDADALPRRRRGLVIDALRTSLEQSIAAAASDPGPTMLRRLTNAEYDYCIVDLTGVRLNVGPQLVSDSVGASGFTNSATAQFMQDATLERYLEAAKIVAGHAVIGAGPIYFFEDPGQTGMELSAIKRLQQLYQQHGFRASAGEGAKPYGMERFKKAFQVAWKYRYRDELGQPSATLSSLAESGGLEPKFAKHIWEVLQRRDAGFPLSEIIEGWNVFQRPAEIAGDVEAEIENASAELFDQVQSWQRRFAGSASSEEEAALLSWNNIDVPSSTEFRARAVRRRVVTDNTFTPDLNNETIYSEDGRIRMELIVEPASRSGGQSPAVIFLEPHVRFRYIDIVEPDPVPLKSLLSEAAIEALQFGQNPGGETISEDAFVVRVGQTKVIPLELPDDSRVAEFLVEARLDTRLGRDSVVRCTIADATNERGREYSTLLRDRESESMDHWEAGLEEFGTALPQISHREPAPSDRDPIPEPYENRYNLPERNFFHTAVKYHRDDVFLTKHVIDDKVADQLNIAWTDLLSSFDFHDVNLRFVARKFGLDLEGRTIESIDQAWILRQTESVRRYLTAYKSEFDAMQAAIRSAEHQHLRDVTAFAQRAWRRGVTADERADLKRFYRDARENQDLDHRAAIRATLVRVLVSPAFLYRIESAGRGPAATTLSDFEVASRLSFSLWSSLPDEPLIRAAQQGRLQDPSELRRQVKRMIRSPKARRMGKEFFGQWLGFYQFDQFRGVDLEQFPEFDARLRSSMYDQATSFFEYVLRHDRPYQEILQADYSFLNASTAQHYGIKTDLEPTARQSVLTKTGPRRGGLFGLGAVLASTSAPLRTSPVKRGDWILRRLIGTPVPPPPADAGSIPAEEVLDDGKTVRDRLEAHRTRAECMNCHLRIDPLGFALENFDSLGRWRETYLDGQPIDASGTLADGRPIVGIDGLREYMQSMDASFRRTLSTKLVAYMLGRSETVADAALIGRVDDQLASDARISVAVETVVQSPQFLQIRPETPPKELANVIDAETQGRELE